MTKTLTTAANVRIYDVVQVPFFPEDELYRVISKATYPDDTVELHVEPMNPDTPNPMTSRRCHRTVNYIVVT